MTDKSGLVIAHRHRRCIMPVDNKLTHKAHGTDATQYTICYYRNKQMQRKYMTDEWKESAKTLTNSIAGTNYTVKQRWANFKY